MRVAFLNLYYPPDAAITGRSLAELVSHFNARFPEVEIRVYAGAGSYEDRSVDAPAPSAEVVRLGSDRRPRGKIARLLRCLREGRRMAREAVGWGDVIVSLTDPPLVGLWLGRERARAGRRTRWIEWTMDLYPEAFDAAGLIGRDNPLYRAIVRSQKRYAPDARICLGEAQASTLSRLRGAQPRIVVLPCGVPEMDIPPEGSAPPAWREGESRTIIAYAGNLGEAHCPDLLPALVEAADPGGFAFVFAPHGKHAESVRARLSGRENITWLKNIPSFDLMHADVHAASLLPAWTSLCVPSKAVSSVCLGKPLLFAGDPAGDIGLMLGAASWILPVPADGRYDRGALSRILGEMKDPALIAEKRRAAATLRVSLQARKETALETIAELIVGAGEPARAFDAPARPREVALANG